MDETGDCGSDPFAPPAKAVEVRCLHCGETYESYLIWWEERETEGGVHGFWCCPTRGCDGIGFGFDILPTDPNYRDENGGWVHFDEDAVPGPHRQWRGLESRWWMNAYRASLIRRALRPAGRPSQARRVFHGPKGLEHWRNRRRAGGCG